MCGKLGIRDASKSAIEDPNESLFEDVESNSMSAPSKDDLVRWRLVEGFSLIVFTALQIFRPILIRIDHKEATRRGFSFLGSTTVFATEVLKLLFSCILVPIHHKSITRLFTSVYHSFTVNKAETLKICLPAFIYVLQNNLYYFALQRIDATLFTLTYQLSILTTAILMVIIMDRRFSNLQWLALFLSLGGAITVQLGQPHHAHGPQPSGNLGLSDQLVGLCAVLVMCMTNAFGGVYLELVMKQSDEDIFLQNIRLSLVSLPIAALSMFSEYDTIREFGFFIGWNYLIVIVVVTGAFGGIVVSSVIRYADNIKKSFCQVIGLGGIAFISILMGDALFNYYLLAGVLLVLFSVVLYTFAPTKKPSAKEVEELNDECEERNDSSVDVSMVSVCNACTFESSNYLSTRPCSC